MPYIVNFTDKDNKAPITVFDNTSSQDTSLTFPGRNVTGYGQIIAENFLAVLENFASANEPVNPVEGQLWYDTQNGVLQLFDNTNWKAASNIQKSPVEPSVENSKIGELWVDTTNQQLRIYTGTRWLLVGPSESSLDGLRYGPAIERIVDSDNTTRNILIFYIADNPVAIISKDTFTPKVDISGFDQIRAGFNVAQPGSDDERQTFEDVFTGGLLPKIIGTASSADALNVGETEVAAGKFLRSDVVNTTEFGFNIRNNTGLIVGIDGNFNLSTSETAAKIYNSAGGSSIDLQINRNGVPSTILRVLDNKVGINVAAPDAELDVDGNAKLTGKLEITDESDAINLQTGSIITEGGVSIQKNLRIGTNLNVEGLSTLKNVNPEANVSYDLGTSGVKWRNIFAKKITAEEIVGTINGNITGNANTATNLKNTTRFSLAGDVVSPGVSFDGQVGSYEKVFNTELTANIIKSKNEPSPNRSTIEDQVLVYRASEEVGASSGLLKQNRDTFVGDLGVPIGTMFPYAGSNVPYGYLLCDGSEIEQKKYPQLYDIIGTTYNGSAILNGVGTFRLPDLRGRFPLGRHNMDNVSNLVPVSGGGFVDGGGGTPTPTRVDGVEAEQIGAASGSSTVNLTLGNLPDHEHTLSVNGVQYGAVRVDDAVTPPGVTRAGPTAAGQAQYLEQSGGIKKPNADFNLGAPVGVMNPYLTLNYIIRSGPPAFETIGT